MFYGDLVVVLFAIILFSKNGALYGRILETSKLNRPGKTGIVLMEGRHL
jgi:hypothetical protein